MKFSRVYISLVSWLASSQREEIQCAGTAWVEGRGKGTKSRVKPPESRASARAGPQGGRIASHSRSSMNEWTQRRIEQCECLESAVSRGEGTLCLLHSRAVLGRLYNANENVI
jgi:hypothetical protein